MYINNNVGRKQSFSVQFIKTNIQMVKLNKNYCT